MKVWKSFCSENVISQLTFSMKTLSLLNLFTQRLYCVIEPFARSPVVRLSDTVETHNTRHKTVLCDGGSMDVKVDPNNH